MGMAVVIAAGGWNGKQSGAEGTNREELVWVSSTALFIALSCRQGREGALMLLCGAGRNVQSGGFETSWRGVWVFFQ